MVSTRRPSAASGRRQPSPTLSSQIVIYLRHNLRSPLVCEKLIHNTPPAAHMPEDGLSPVLNANALDIRVMLSYLSGLVRQSASISSVGL
jgi:hypothetical protein